MPEKNIFIFMVNDKITLFGLTPAGFYFPTHYSWRSFRQPGRDISILSVSLVI